MASLRNLLAVLFTIISVVAPVSAQERGYMLSKYYPSNLSISGLQNWSIVEDNRGVMYFGNQIGVLEFDGVNWKNYPVSNNMVVRSLAKDMSGTIYVGSYAELGRMSVDSVGQLYYESLMNLIDRKYTDFEDVWCIHALSDTILFLSDNCLFRLVNNKFDYFPCNGDGYYLSYVVNDEYYVQEINRGLLKLQGDSLALVCDKPIFKDLMVHGIFHNPEGYLVTTRSDGFFILDSFESPSEAKSFSSISPKAAAVNEYFKKYNYYHGINLPNGTMALSSVMADLLIVDSDWNIVDVIDKKTKQNDSEVLYLYLQSNNSLWLALGDGICKVEALSELRYWDDELGAYGILNDVGYNGNNFFISTKQGLFCMSNECDYFGYSHFEKIDQKFEASNTFLVYKVPNSSKKILLLTAATGIYEVEGKKAIRIASCRNPDKIYQSIADSSLVFSTTTNGVNLLRYDCGKWIDMGIQFGVNDQVVDLRLEPNGDIWMLTQVKGVYRVQNYMKESPKKAVVSLYDSLSGYPQNVQVYFDSCLFKVSDYEYYTFNDSLNIFEQTLLDTTSQETTGISHSNHDISSITKKRVELVANSVFYYYSEGYNEDDIWFSSSDGVVRYRTAGYFPETVELPNTIIRKVISLDSVLFSGVNPKKIGSRYVCDTTSFVNIGTVLPYKNRSITFNYACPIYERENKVEYSYKLNGFNDTWSEWGTDTKKEYTNLNAGSYTFWVRARYLDTFITAPAAFSFTIRAPWYTSFLAFVLYGLALLFIISVVVRINTLRLIHEKDKLEAIVKQRTQEIQVQNEEIIVQAEHLRDVNSRVTKQNVELSQQKVALEQKTHELEISNATKNRFFRIIAHDLRNPISTFVTSTNLILADFESFNNDKIRIILEELNKMSHNTYNLLENLLDWSTSQMGSIKFSPKQLDIKQIIDENIDLLEAKFKSKTLAVSVEVPAETMVWGDEDMIKTVVRNLLTNATKFTHDNGAIRVYSAVRNGYCNLCIEDNGVGISPENIAKLFRVDDGYMANGTHNEKGSGLGLILSKDFVERCGGCISVNSELGKGSTFIIKIPTSEHI